MQSANSSHISQRPRFPALDPEPPPRRLRRVGAVLVVVILAGLGSWLGFTKSGTTPHHSAVVPVSYVRGLTGVVLAEAPSSVLAATDMQAGKAVMLSNLGQFSSNPYPAVSADGKFLLDAAIGKLLSLASLSHPQTAPNALSFSPGNMPGSLADPWSDHDSGVVELNYPTGVQGLQSTIAVAAVESVRTGRAVSLGPADSAAGDPQQAGAFIAVPKRGKPFPNGLQPDGGIVLADAGARSRLLATTAQLNHALGNKRGTAVSLFPIPNPQGSMVAVQVLPISNGTAGIVVLSRNGALLGSQPLGGGWAGWSHSGSTLAVADAGYAGAELTEWKIGASSVTTALHDSSRRGPTACAWSPDDTSVVCDGGPHGNWLVIRSGTESVTAGSGQPLVWVNGRLG
jgi:hypothetical protein